MGTSPATSSNLVLLNASLVNPVFEHAADGIRLHIKAPGQRW